MGGFRQFPDRHHPGFSKYPGAEIAYQVIPAGLEGNTGNGETPDDTGNSGNSGTGNSGETDDDDSIISEIDFTIPVTSDISIVEDGIIKGNPGSLSLPKENTKRSFMVISEDKIEVLSLDREVIYSMKY